MAVSVAPDAPSLLGKTRPFGGMAQLQVAGCWFRIIGNSLEFLDCSHFFGFLVYLPEALKAVLSGGNLQLARSMTRRHGSCELSRGVIDSNPRSY
jgi:hypothetical protein